MTDHDQLYIGGVWTDPATKDRIEVISPHTEQVVGSVPEASVADVDKAVAVARETFDRGDWSAAPVEDRILAVQRFSDAYAAKLGDMATVITEEMGSPISFSNLAQAPASWMMLNAFITIAQSYPWEEQRPGVFGDVIVRREPVGVVAGIVPWNVPQFVTMSKLAPALLSGCSIVVKPAPETPLDSYLMADCLDEAGIPKGVVSFLPAGREVGEHLVRHPDVDKVTFTGSTAAGRRIMSICGERVARVTLELGGKSAGIVADDIDLEEFLGDLVSAGIDHSGQVCAALTRIVVPRHRHDEIVDAVADIMRAVVVGDPTDPETVLGPLAAERQRDRVEAYVALGIQEGARVVVGGRRPPHLERGWFYEPTLFAEVDNSMRIAQEEIFGPVLCVIPFDDADDAIRIANDSIYGLSGAVYANDLELAARIAQEVRAGQMWVNTWGMCITQPFGGFKQSGLGREGGTEGMSPYLELKLIEGL